MLRRRRSRAPAQGACQLTRTASKASALGPRRDQHLQKPLGSRGKTDATALHNADRKGVGKRLLCLGATEQPHRPMAGSSARATEPQSAAAYVLHSLSDQDTKHANGRGTPCAAETH